MRFLEFAKWFKGAADHLIIARVICLQCVRSLRESLNFLFIAINGRQLTHFLLAIWWVVHQISNVTSLRKNLIIIQTLVGRAKQIALNCYFIKWKVRLSIKRRVNSFSWMLNRRKEKLSCNNRIFPHCQLMFMWLTRNYDMLMHLDPSFLILTYKHVMKVTSLIKLTKWRRKELREM